MSMATKSSTTVFEKLSDCEMEAIDVHNDLMDEGWSHQHSYNVSGAYLDLCNYIAAGGTL
ncbi:hypothetical protein FG167_05885 [Lacinutrix sp. WUR7]|uniref:hypothetical protein n=1 Tax=Lacinutrix sp. WUR7 TaxID=2653681 RepID=UPI00193E12FA|nr:hypothetical protein [Lacinutrix sp. WUR7]QRM88783.1 hypothetical protein FG167_05885 [Lacinutrix sp. WUR7]